MVRLREDAEYFARFAIGVEPDPQQSQILRAISVPGAKVTVRAGHSTGKTACLAWVALWFISMHPDCRVPCTAPTAHQLHDILWPEVEKPVLSLFWAQDVMGAPC